MYNNCCRFLYCTAFKYRGFKVQKGYFFTVRCVGGKARQSAVWRKGEHYFENMVVINISVCCIWLLSAVALVVLIADWPIQ